jgi:predicted MFS family arabinose efflux permease
MAMRLVPERHASRAASVVMSGISIGAVAGIPLGTTLESLTDWRTTFLIWSGLSALVFVAVAVLVPSLPSANAVSVREVFLLPLRNGPLRLVLTAVVLFVLGHFGAYTFVRPFLEEHAGATPLFVTITLMAYGAGGAIGNLVAGPVVARNARGGFLAGSAGLVASLLALLFLGQSAAGAVVTLVVWGVAFGVVQLSQVTMTQAAAPETFEAAMSLNTMAYNTSIALGALVGGVFADRLGVSSVVWFGIGLTAAALLLVLAAQTSRTRRPLV